MRKILISLCVITALLLFLVTKNTDDTIIIYSSAEQFRGEELQRQLSEKFPDIKTRVMYVPTAKAAAKISMEKTGSDADIIVGVETSYMDKMEDSFADISGTSKLNFLDELAPAAHDNRYVTWERFAGCFIINKSIMEKNNLPIPQTYEDLLNPQYEGLIAMPDPKSSGTGYFYYKNLVNVMGEEKALQYIDDLEKNIKQFTESGSGPIKLLKQGEIAIGLGMTFQAVNEINGGNDFEIIYPPEGSPYSLTGTAMIEGRQDDEHVQTIFRYIVNEFLLYDKEHFSPEKILKDQVNTIENYPQDIQYADMTGIDDMKEKERLLALWKY